MAGSSAASRQGEIADLVIGWRSVPHPALRIAEEFANRVFRVREWIFNRLARPGIKAAEYVHVVRGIPDVIVGIDTETIGGRLRSWQWIFREGLRFWIKSSHLPGVEFAKPDDSIGSNFQAAWKASWRRWCP